MRVPHGFTVVFAISDDEAGHEVHRYVVMLLGTNQLQSSVAASVAASSILLQSSVAASVAASSSCSISGSLGQ